MTSLPEGEKSASVGSQTPRILWVPDYTTSSGPEAVEFCASVGVPLDPWQRLTLQHGLAETPDHKWAAFEVGLVVPRQNGKGEDLMARELSGLFLFEENLLLHSAHRYGTCHEHFLRIVSVITNCDSLRRRISKIRYANGEEAIELITGERLLFLARTGASGRGLTGDVIVLDEAQILGDGPVRAMLPTLSARPNPQIWYAGTAGNAESIQLGAVRRRALAGNDTALTFLEWSCNENDPDFDPGDPNQWAISNPALGIRISVDYIQKERAAMSPEGFASERLGIGDWPIDQLDSVIDADQWGACADKGGPKPDPPLVLAVDVDPQRTGGAIAVAGARLDGLLAVEIADVLAIEQIVPRIEGLLAENVVICLVVDRGGPAGSLVPALEALGVEILVPTPQECAQAAEGFYDAVLDGRLRHQSDPRLDIAVAGGKQRPLGDAWGWARRKSSTDIKPLVAASFALWGYSTQAVHLGQPNAFVI